MKVEQETRTILPAQSAYQILRQPILPFSCIHALMRRFCLTSTRYTSKGESLQGRRKCRDLTIDYKNLISADLQIYRMFLDYLSYFLLWNKKQISNLKCKLIIWSPPWNKIERSTEEEISVQKLQKMFCFNPLAHQAVYANAKLQLTSAEVLYFTM